jgi:hypothetical protein
MPPFTICFTNFTNIIGAAKAIFSRARMALVMELVVAFITFTGSILTYCALNWVNAFFDT